MPIISPILPRHRATGVNLSGAAVSNNRVDFPWFSRDPKGDGVQNPRTSGFVCKVADESRPSRAEVGLLALEAADAATCLDSVFTLLWQVPASGTGRSRAAEVMSVFALGKPAPDADSVKEIKAIKIYLRREKNSRQKSEMKIIGFKMFGVITGGGDTPPGQHGDHLIRHPSISRTKPPYKPIIAWGKMYATLTSVVSLSTIVQWSPITAVRLCLSVSHNGICATSVNTQTALLLVLCLSRRFLLFFIHQSIFWTCWIPTGYTLNRPSVCLQVHTLCSRIH